MKIEQRELLTKLQDQEFVVSTQIDPPSTPSLDELYSDVARLKQAGVALVDINTSRRLSHDAVWLAANLKDSFGLEVIPHISPRDSSIPGLMKQILTAYVSSGIHDFLVISGDPYQTAATVNNNHYRDSIDALKAFDSHLRRSNLELNLTFAAAVNQNEQDKEREGDRLRAKVSAGADLFMSQPVFTPDQADMAWRFYRKHTDKPLILGVWPLINSRTVENIHAGKVVGVEIPDEVYEEAISCPDDESLRQWGLAKAHELAALIRDTKLAQGLYIVAPLRKPSQLTEFMERINGI